MRARAGCTLARQERACIEGGKHSHSHKMGHMHRLNDDRFNHDTTQQDETRQPQHMRINHSQNQTPLPPRLAVLVRRRLRGLARQPAQLARSGDEGRG